MTPRLTVFTTFYDATAYVDQTIASVLGQTFADFEYLIINDGDPAESERIRRKFSDDRIRIVDQPHDSLARKRDRGLREARGEYVGMIDADDVCEPARFEEQVRFLDAHPDHAVVGSALRLIDEHSRTIGTRPYPREHEEIARTLLRWNCIAQPAVTARRDALLLAGGYRDISRWTEDYDLWLRVARIARLHNLGEALVAYRIHSQSNKSSILKSVLRDTIATKLRALREYGYRWTPAVALNIAAHGALMLLPPRLVLALFMRRFIAPA